jgi:hypothetical protein
MTTTDLSKYNKCIVRHTSIKITPEEKVRQLLLGKMIGELGFPKGLLSVERKVGTRRYDVVCHTPDGTPLLLVECKATSLHDEAMQQAQGYNSELKAPFICLVCETAIKTFWQEKKGLVAVPFLPTYKELYDVFKRL